MGGCFLSVETLFAVRASSKTRKALQKLRVDVEIALTWCCFLYDEELANSTENRNGEIKQSCNQLAKERSQ